MTTEPADQRWIIGKLFGDTCYLDTDDEWTDPIVYYPPLGELEPTTEEDER